MNREDLQLPNALLVYSPTPLGRSLGAQSRYLIARPRIHTFSEKFTDCTFSLPKLKVHSIGRASGFSLYRGIQLISIERNGLKLKRGISLS